MRRAVIDVGSNSVLLVVAEGREGAWSPILDESEVTGLGTGTKATGLLEAGFQDRTLAAVRRFWRKATDHGAECAAIGTMALRIAKNASEFLDRARGQGTPVVTISGEVEAELGLRSVTSDATFGTGPVVTVIDPGGHSTELTVAVEGAATFRHSYPVGALGLLDGPMGAESPDAPARFAAAVEIDRILEETGPEGPSGVVVALGATPTNLVTVLQGIAEWDASKVHGQYLGYEDVGRSVGSLCAMSERERARLPGMEPGREKTLHVGALILERFLHKVRAEGCFVSTRGWRYAALDDASYFCGRP